MGKCSGLKGGGHHRKSIDVADKKRNEKKARKAEQEAAGKRAIILQELLGNNNNNNRHDHDRYCDIYLEATTPGFADSNNGNDSNSTTTTRDGCTGTELCRANFRGEDCSNRRCKFSHDLSIAEALQNVISGTSNNNSDDDSPLTIPALRYLPGIIGGDQNNGGRQRRMTQRPRRSREDDVDVDVSSLSLQPQPSPFENSLSEGSSVMNTIITYLDSNSDVLSLALSCSYLHHLVLIAGGNDNESGNGNNASSTSEGDGRGCRDVQRRRYHAKEARVLERNAALLKSKAVGGRLRYVVSYVDTSLPIVSDNIMVDDDNSDNCSALREGRKGKKKKNGKKKKSNHRWRPILVYDYENPNVYRAFREGAR